MTPAEMLSEPLLTKEELEYMINDINQVWSKKCQSHEIFVADNYEKTGVNIFGGYSEDLCENENEQAMFDAAYAYGWE